MFRELTARILENHKWHIDQLAAYNVNSPKELADKIRQSNSFSGEEAITSIAEHFNITIAIFMKDRGQTRIKINHKDESEIIYLEFTHGKYADKDLEGHCNSLIPKINSHIKSKNHIEKLINEIKIESTILQNYPKNKFPL